MTSESCRYLYAVCCLELGKFTEAEAVLLPDDDTESIPNGAAGVHLLGKVYQLSNRPTSAIKQFRTALRLDPLLWCAFEELCSLGPETDAQEYLQMDGGSRSVTDYRHGYQSTCAPRLDSITDISPQNAAINACTQAKTPVIGQTEIQMDSETYETPHAAPQAVQPPPMKKIPRESVQYAESPMMLSEDHLLGGRKFLDEGTVRKVNFKVLVFTMSWIDGSLILRFFFCRYLVSYFQNQLQR